MGGDGLRGETIGSLEGLEGRVVVGVGFGGGGGGRVGELVVDFQVQN